MSRYNAGDNLDGYFIVELLGTGAYNESYKATDTRTGKTVVLKIPDPNLFADPATYNRYKREADIAKKLHHPAVQGAIDDREKRSEPYLVLSFVEGESLSTRLRREGGAFSIPLVVDWGGQLATALAYLHAQGVVHRDLKPGNVLVGAGDRLVIADFGTAHLDGARRLTFKHLTGMLGTPDYMSPEQAQGSRGDARSDLYAWGVMMYQLLTGKVPFTGGDWMLTMAAHLQSDPKPIRQLRPEVPLGLEAIVGHAMRRYPEHRYASADEILRDLNRSESLNLQTYDLSPEKPMGSLVAGGAGKGLFGRMFKNRGG
ncbi:MAG: serine/threonine-protein kinase [Acidimicrobiales bacterium]